MDVDCWGVVNGTKVFLPHLISSGDGHVDNISSVFGLLSVPGQAAYNAAKFAVRGFTEALRQEMIVAGHPVKVTTVHPGGIKTGIAHNMETAEGLDKDALTKIFDKRLASTSAAEGRADHSERRPQEQGASARPATMPSPRLPRPRHWFGLSKAGRRGDIAAAPCRYSPRLAAADLPSASVRKVSYFRGVSRADTHARGKRWRCRRPARSSGSLRPTGVRRGTRQPPGPGGRRRPSDAASAPAPRCPARLPPR